MINPSEKENGTSLCRVQGVSLKSGGKFLLSQIVDHSEPRTFPNESENTAVS